MARLWRRRGVSETDAGAEVAEAMRASFAQPVPAYPSGAAVARRGIDPGIPMGGTSVMQPSATLDQGRRELCDQLYGAYLACPWSSACVDIIARTITAGGLEIVPNIEAADDPAKLLRAKPRPPKGVLDLQRMIDFCNPREDIRQLARGAIVDLLVPGDAFIEVVWFLGQPVAIYSLESATMFPIADEHGNISAYEQAVDPGRTVHFEPHEVIQISLDAPRGGVFGVSPTQKLLLPITDWLFTAGLLKETMRKGNPPRVHFNYDAAAERSEMQRDFDHYVVRNLGIANTGNPLFSKGAQALEFKPSAVLEYLETLRNDRDTITSGYGVPNRKVGVAEPGSLGGQGAEAGQDRTFEVNTCAPYESLLLEKLNFAFVPAFGIEGWETRFGEVDWRDDETIERIRDTRLRNGSQTLNRIRAEIGEPPVDGGDIAVLVDRQNLVAWSDLPALSKANVAATAAKGAAWPGGPKALPGDQEGTESLTGPGLAEYERRRQAVRRALAELGTAS